MSKELKPCPMCGGGAAFKEDGEGGQYIECQSKRCEITTNLRYACGEDPKPLLAEVWNRRAQPEPAAPADVGPMTERLLDDLKSALNLMLTFFGMDEGESSKEVFDAARQAYNFAAIVSRPIEPHEREALSMLRSTVHQWHKAAVEKGFDGAASLIEQADAAPSVAPEPVAWTLQSELDAAETTCSAHLWFTNPRNSAWTALFTREKIAAHPPRAPLTDAEIVLIMESCLNDWDWKEFARAVESAVLDHMRDKHKTTEAAHGISAEGAAK